MEMIQDFVVRQLLLIAVNLKVYAVICFCLAVVSCAAFADLGKAQWSDLLKKLAKIVHLVGIAITHIRGIRVHGVDHLM